MRKYGITARQRDAMSEAQGGVCAFPGCERSEASEHLGLHVDHCHATGEVRGLLCLTHNQWLGAFERVAAWAPGYLETPPARKILRNVGSDV